MQQPTIPNAKTQNTLVSVNKGLHTKCWKSHSQQWTPKTKLVPLNTAIGIPESTPWGTSHNQQSCIKQLSKYSYEEAKTKTASETHISEQKKNEMK